MSFGFKNIVKEALKEADVDLSKEALARGAVNFIFDDLVPSLMPDLNAQPECPYYVGYNNGYSSYAPEHPFADTDGYVENYLL